MRSFSSGGDQAMQALLEEKTNLIVVLTEDKKKLIELVMKVQDNLMKVQDNLMKVQDNLTKVQDSSMEDKKNLMEDKAYLKKIINELELEKKVLESKLVAIVNMRSLIENLLSIWKPGLMSTAASQKLVSEHILKDGKLTPGAMQFLVQLEGSSTKTKPVVHELNDLYHELSKKLHYPDLPGTGFFCGGEMPLRAAVGIVLLTLQRETGFKANIRYCNEDYQPTAVLRGGKVFKFEETNDVESE
jgi:hypothetical protein